jgi:hypothetical protein
MTTLSDIIVANAAGAPIRLAANTTTDNLYLRTVSGAIGYAAIQGSHIVGAGISRTNDTNIQITLGGATTDGLLRAVTLTMGWAGQLAVDRGGTGAATLTGVLIGNGTSAVSGVVGTADQLLRRNAGNTAYEFFTPNYLGNPMIQLGDIIYGNASGAPLRLAANSSGSNQYLRSVSSGAPGWASIAGSDITGAAITTANDTNILITASGNTSSALLRTLTLTAGWTGSLAVGRGGTGAATLTGVLIGNGTSAVTGITGTASQLLRRNAGNTAYEFFTPDFINGSGTINFLPIWTASGTLGTSPVSVTGSEANFGSNKLVAGNVSATNGSIMLQDNYSTGHLGNIGTMFSGGNLMLGYCVTPSTSSATSFLSATTLPLTRSAVVVGENVSIYTGSAQTVAVGSSVTMSEKLRLTNAGDLQIITGNIQLNTATNITWGGAYGTDIPTISGTSGSGSNGFLQFYPAGSTSGVKMALRRTGQLSLPSYTSSSAFTGTSVATLAVTNAGDIITIAPQQVTASGTYTPTWTGLANVTSVTAFSCQYMRVGDTVTVSGWVTIDPVSDNTPTSLSFSLPINSDVSVVNRLNGTGVTQGGGAAASLSGYGSNFGEFEVIPSLATAVNYAFHFTYRIV